MGLIAGRNEAFGAPGIAPTWCSSDKDFVTTALGRRSNSPLGRRLARGKPRRCCASRELSVEPSPP
jgi:hypothetical protein